MTKGRKPLPANVHVMNGNPSKKNIAALSNGARIESAIPKMPSHLDTIARKEWRRIGEELLKLGLVTKIDMAALAAYCCFYSEWVQCEKKLKDIGFEQRVITTANGYLQQNAWVSLRNNALSQMKSYLVEFGMTPSSRSRVDVTPQQDLFGDDGSSESDSKNPAAKYFSAG